MKTLSKKDKIIAAIIAAIIAGSCAGIASYFGIGIEEDAPAKVVQVEVGKYTFEVKQGANKVEVKKVY